MLQTEPEKLAKVLHDLYVLLPIIEEHGGEEWLESHLNLIDYFSCRHAESVSHWSYFEVIAA